VSVVAIIPAAGKGTRLGGSTPKQFLEIARAPILIHTLRRFDACHSVDEIWVALPPDRIAAFSDEARRHSIQKKLQLIEGGNERSDSIFGALTGIESSYAKEAKPLPELVIIHDAVRPFVTAAQIDAVLDSARLNGAAILALGATDTIKEANQGRVVRTLDRRTIYCAQTPQAFKFELFRKANELARAENLPSDSLTDDSMLVERVGIPVGIVEGSASNIKITTSEDLAYASRLLGSKDSEPGTAFRTGIGYDIHRLVKGKRLVLGGVEIDFEYGLEGHSDGDSLTHAICDALLGAASLGDIGTHFPPSDDRWKGADSLRFLSHVTSLVNECGFRIENVDATVFAERPRLAQHSRGMREKLSLVLGLDVSRINVKAKTNEGLDAIGRGEAIAAQAIALISTQ